MQIRTLSSDEVKLAVVWAAAEGWNPGLFDAESFYAADPQGFIGAFIDEELVGTISAVRYGDDFSFLGFYIVAPQFRGRGIGTALWAAAMERVSGSAVGLDGVLEMQSAYELSGFKLAHRNVRYGGVPHRAGSRSAGQAGELRELSTGDLEAIATLDRECFGAERNAFLSDWIQQPHARTAGVFQGENCLGFSVLRECGVGFKFGPVFAESREIAQFLVEELLKKISPGSQIFLDVSVDHAAGVELAKGLGLEPVFETVRMYANGQPAIDQPKVFGVTSFELG